MPTLNWAGKDKILNHHREVPYCVLDKQYEFDENGIHTSQAEWKHGTDVEPDENMIIHGDNLYALKALLPKYEGKVDCIYIDPPYNTGNEGWVYNDNVNDPHIKKWLGEVVGKEGEDLSRHDKWLCMIYPRLKLLWKLLNPLGGTIFISIDENEFANLKLICEEIFGKTHHVATIAWQKRYSRENRGAIGDAHEYILIYSTDVECFKLKRNRLPMDETQAKVYKNPNNDPRGRWRAIPMTAQGFRPNQMYPIEDPKGNIHYPPEGRCWSTIESEYLKLRSEGRIYFGKNNDSQPNVIRYLSEVEGVVPWTWWPHTEVGHTDEAKKEIMQILGSNQFDTPKPVRLIEQILRIATKKDSLILDSFAGSATTAHAVLRLNHTDDGNRKFILIEMMDYASSVTAERVKRVINGYGDVDGIPGLFSYYELGPTLFNENGLLNDLISFEKIRNYVWFMETRTPFKPTGSDNPYFMGKEFSTSYWFYYEKEQKTVLDIPFFESIDDGSDSYVIYADACTLPRSYMDEHNINFKKIPREIPRL